MMFYVYRVTNLSADPQIHYYGSRGSSLLPTNDLGLMYFTSSKIVSDLNKEHCNVGVPKSEEHKQKIREAAIRRWSNPDNRMKQSETLKAVRRG